MFGLTKAEESILRKLKTPVLVQDYLDRLPINHEKRGETILSPRLVLREQKAHCIEGAMLAATAFWLQGQRPLLLDLKTRLGDDEHVVALFKVNGYWGAISKTNHTILRYRDPIYRTVRELALSYFHEYFRAKDGQKTLVSYSRPFDLSRYGDEWVTMEESWWEIDGILNGITHYPFVPGENKRHLRPASQFERAIVYRNPEWKKSNPKT